MANITDYILDNQEKLTKDNFNEVDNLVFSVLSYIDFSGVLETGWWDTEISLSEALNKYTELHKPREIATYTMFMEDLSLYISALKASKRYADVKVGNYINIADHGGHEQFRAVTAYTEDKLIICSFSGTDLTITGWRENFEMSFKCPVPAQYSASMYIKLAAERMKGDIIITGHSKGGNLSNYALAKQPLRVFERIIAAYNNDGPGFKREFLESEDYIRSRPKIIKVIPDNSFIGTLLDNEDDLYEPVESIGVGFNGHNLFYWVVDVDNKCLVHQKQLGKVGKFFESATDDWLKNYDDEFRETFVNAFFDTLSKGGIEKLTDVMRLSPKNLIGIIHSFHELPLDLKKVVTEVMLNLIYSGTVNAPILAEHDLNKETIIVDEKGKQIKVKKKNADEKIALKVERKKTIARERKKNIISAVDELADKILRIDDKE